MTPSAGFWRRRGDGIDLFVRLTPKAARDTIDGVAEAADGTRHLKARVRAVPEKGKANAALVRLVADALDLPASAIAIVSGETARLKTLRIDADPALLEPTLASLDRPS